MGSKTFNGPIDLVSMCGVCASAINVLHQPSSSTKLPDKHIVLGSLLVIYDRFTIYFLIVNTSHTA